MRRDLLTNIKSMLDSRHFGVQCSEGGLLPYEATVLYEATGAASVSRRNNLNRAENAAQPHPPTAADQSFQ